MPPSPASTAVKPESRDIPTSLPDPQTFDLLPQLHSLLSRLVPNPSNPTATSGDLEPQNLPAAATALKNRLQKARHAVQELPDMNRTVEEQEAEIQLLETELSKKMEMLARLKKAVAGGMNGQ
jgi:hypothetical protein